MAMQKSDYILGLCMLITGALNTITTQFANKEEALGIDGTVREFNHPFFQAACMFLGESLCMVAYRAMVAHARMTEKVDESLEASKFNPVLFLIPALCDLTGTSLMYVGLTLTYTSVFQMLRGSVVIFTGILSVTFLGRKLHGHHWAGMGFVMLGLALVGIVSVVQGSSGGAADNPLLGDILVICAQVIVAVQMVVEEKLLSKHKVPALMAVGFEGMWGFLVLSILLVPMYYFRVVLGDHAKKCLHNGDECRWENSPDAFTQMGNSWKITLFLCGNIFSIAFFNYFGISVTKKMSATHRMVLDSVRTIIVWIASLAFGWEKLSVWSPLQVVGFIVLFFGTLVYNEIVRLPFLTYPAPDAKKDALLGGDGDETLVTQTGNHMHLENEKERGLSKRISEAASVTLHDYREQTPDGFQKN